ncbi:MAG TPA: CHRD domain-containing protein [Janthinobacterium sp.]|nr:CHRD domain-containing protein [Janthinobacterium sp.]
MNTVSKRRKLVCLAALSGVILMGAGCSSMGGRGGGTLSGAQEVPPNPSTASGTSTIKVAPDKSVTGMVTYTGLAATAAHIHEAAPGSNGAVIVPLIKASESSFSVPPGAVLTDTQYNDYLAGNLYVNVHSATYPGGEIRMQLKPK